MCCPVGCAWHIYVNGRSIVVSFQKNSLGKVVERCMACKCMVWLKVHGMVHGKRCIVFLSTPVSIRKVLSKRKAFLAPGWPNVDSSSFAHHHTWQAGLVKWEPKQTSTMQCC